MLLEYVLVNEGDINPRVMVLSQTIEGIATNTASHSLLRNVIPKVTGKASNISFFVLFYF